MSWLYSRALVGAYSAGSCSDGDASAPSKLTPMPAPVLPRGKTTKPSSHSRFGMMFAVLTADYGGALLTWFRAGFRAKISALPEKARDLNTEKNQDSGGNMLASFARWNRDSCLWKIPQLSLFEASTSCSVTWPRSGMMRDGVCFQRQTPARPTNANDYGLGLRDVPTPTVNGNYNRKGLSPKSGDGLATWAKKFPTPTTQDTGSRFNQSIGSSHRRPTLGAMAKFGLWPTATAHDARDSGVAPSQFLRRSATLPMAVGGKLNAAWVEWLMGWPIGATGLDALGTDKYRLWLRLHGAR